MCGVCLCVYLFLESGRTSSAPYSDLLHLEIVPCNLDAAHILRVHMCIFFVQSRDIAGLLSLFFAP